MLRINGKQDLVKNIEKLAKYRFRLNLWNKKRQKSKVKIPNKHDIDKQIAAENKKKLNLSMLSRTDKTTTIAMNFYLVI